MNKLAPIPKDEGQEIFCQDHLNGHFTPTPNFELAGWGFSVGSARGSLARIRDCSDGSVILIRIDLLLSAPELMRALSESDRLEVFETAIQQGGSYV